jgi:hypothetical protein
LDLWRAFGVGRLGGAGDVSKAVAEPPHSMGLGRDW